MDTREAVWNWVARPADPIERLGRLLRLVLPLPLAFNPLFIPFTIWLVRRAIRAACREQRLANAEQLVRDGEQRFLDRLQEIGYKGQSRDLVTSVRNGLTAPDARRVPRLARREAWALAQAAEDERSLRLTPQPRPRLRGRANLSPRP